MRSFYGVGSRGIPDSGLTRVPQNKWPQILDCAIQAQFQATLFK